MKIFLYISVLNVCFLININAQSVVPQAKTKAERKAENKKKSLEERIESVAPVDVSLPKAKGSVNLPGDNNISSIEEAKKFLSETMPDIANNAKTKSKKAKKAIQKAKSEVFDGRNYEKIAISKKVYRKGSGSRLIYQEFYILKNHQAASPYLRSLFWYDSNTKKIVEALKRDTKTNALLHGPFKEYRGETLVAEGFYYLGAKHGRWETYDKDFNLLNKEYYQKGYFQESKISFYDADSLKINEVLPMLYGKLTGAYYKFYEDGTLHTEGNYDDGKKIGKWVEYYQGGNRRKKETQCPNTYFDKTEPFLAREYAADGKLIYDYTTKN